MSNHSIDKKRKLLKAMQTRLLSPSQTYSKPSEAIAIVGLHGFFPQADSLDELWQIVDNDKSVISLFPADRYVGNVSSHEIYGGFIKNIKAFDPLKFGILPMEAKFIDPQQRLLMMSVLDTIHNAGYTRESISGSCTGVYVALEENEYVTCLKENHCGFGSNVLNHHPSMAANRLSYYFDFSGPSKVINTMCASAAYAIHEACEALASGAIEQAIVGGARVLLNMSNYIELQTMQILAKGDVVHSFDVRANGYLRSEGVASLLMMPLEKAKQENKYIYGVIEATAVNYNGAKTNSIAAPDVKRHQALIQACYQKAKLDPRELYYIEAQGMGNPVSDHAEWEAFNSALESIFQEQGLSVPIGHCIVSTIKPQIGHMECVSALGALFRIIRSFETNTIHRINELSEVHSNLDTTGRVCKLAFQTTPWPKTKGKRYAALHSYGSGGNNAHILLSAYEQFIKHPVCSNVSQYRLSDYWFETKQECDKHKKGKYICVIGAGPAGLVMAKSLLEEGHTPIVFEKQSTLGGLWNQSPDPKSGAAYKNTHFQSSKFTSVFSDYYPEDIKNNFYSVSDVNCYLHGYAEKFQLTKCIHYDTEVIEVVELGKKWQVTTKNKDDLVHTEIFDGVALCQGSFWDPMIPTKKGIEHFKGEIMHSAAYYDNSRFANKNVLIIGNGVSAMDIAEEVSATAKSVYWSRRSNKLILPRMVGFVPNDVQSPAQLLNVKNRTNLIERLQYSMPEYYETYKKSGLLPTQEEFNSNPVVHINDGVIQLVADDKIKAVSDIQSFSINSCLTVSGETIDQIDAVIFCTGYKNLGQSDTRYHFLPNISVLNEFSLGIFYEKNPNLVNTSVLPIAYTGSFYFMEMVARWYAQQLSGRFLLTEAEKRERITSNHAMIMAPISNVIFGLRLELLPNPKTDFEEFWRLINYPAFSPINRLAGMHSDPAAEENLARMVRHSFIKTDAYDQELLNVKQRILAAFDAPTLSNLVKSQQITEKDAVAAKGMRDQAIRLDWACSYITKNQSEEIINSTQRINVLHKLQEILAEIVNIPESEVDVDKYLSQYGFDSISLTVFAQTLSSHFSFIQLDASIFISYPTLRMMSEYFSQQYSDYFISAQEGSTPSKYQKYPQVELMQTGSVDETPLFLFHAALGTVQCYQELVAKIPISIPIYGVLSAGIRNQLDESQTIAECAKKFARMIQAIIPASKVKLAGYSQGGVIAYEVAKQLVEAGKIVERLAIVDAPYPPIQSFLSEELLDILVLQTILQLNQCNVELSQIIKDMCLQSSSPQYQLSDLIKLTNGYGLTIDPVKITELINKFRSIIVHNTKMMSNHSINSNATVLSSVLYLARDSVKQFFDEQLERLPAVMKEQQFYIDNDCIKSWKKLIDSLQVEKVPGSNHFSIINNESCLSKLADFIS